MRRLNPVLDIFSADPGEVITVTVQAKNTVPMATVSALASGGPWTIITVPTPSNPVDQRRFTMPSMNESFAVGYQFSPPPPTGGQSYTIAFASSDGSTDGPKTILRPASSPPVTLGYVFVPTPPSPPSSDGASHFALALAPPGTKSSVASKKAAVSRTAKKAAKKPAKKGK